MKNITKALKLKLLAFQARNINNQLWNKKFHEKVKKILGITVGIGSYGYLKLPRNTIIGNYCSIADGVKYLPGNHPFENVSTAACFFNPELGKVDKKYDINRKNLTICNDVWIGANVLITNSCTEIGNGAVIGAGSVVTHNVPPYSIVCGNPAKVLRMRFSDETIKKLEESRWWENGINSLLPFVDVMNNPEIFVERIKK